VEFRVGGKAYVSAGSVSHACSYSQSGKIVSLICDEDSTNLTVLDDGALAGPPESLMARLTPVSN
jgi:hypothetical protein